MKRLALISSFLVVLLVSCDKFELGGYQYQSSKNIRGTWNYYEVLLDDAKVSDSVFYARYRNSHIEFEEGSLVHFYWHDVDTVLDEQTATYVFNSNKTQLNIVFDAYPFVDQVWQVKKLTKDELWAYYITEDKQICYLKLIKR